MSLSTWFKDYVYIPLGGNRCKVPRHIFNIMVVWTLTGLWHGAAWNFVIWGVYYGILLIFEKYVWGNFLKKLPSLIQHIYTLIIVVIGFAIFALDDFAVMGKYLSVMLLNSNGILFDNSFMFNLTDNIVLLTSGCVLSAPVYNLVKGRFGPFAIVAVTLLFILSVAYLVNASYNPFLYFRF